MTEPFWLVWFGVSKSFESLELFEGPGAVGGGECVLALGGPLCLALLALECCSQLFEKVPEPGLERNDLRLSRRGESPTVEVLLCSV